MCTALCTVCDQVCDSGESAKCKLQVVCGVQTFLKLSKPQKDKLATAYDAHVQRVAAVRKECLTIGTKLQVCPRHACCCLQKIKRPDAACILSTHTTETYITSVHLPDTESDACLGALAIV